MTRYQEVKVARLRAESERLLSRLAEVDRRTRRAAIESRVAQLEAEGLLLDRAEEVDRLSRMSDRDVERAIVSMRRHYRRRGDGSPLPAGANPALDPFAPREEDTVQPGVMPIFGHSIARFASEEEEEGRPIVPYRKEDGGLPPHLARRRNAIKRARLGVRRFQASRSEVTRA